MENYINSLFSINHALQNGIKSILNKYKVSNSSLPGRQATENHTKNEGAAMVLYFTGTGNSRYLARRIADFAAPMGLSLFHFAPQTRTCRGEAPPSCCRKTVLSLKSPTGAFIAPLRSTNANLSGRGPSILLTQDRSVA